MLFAPLPPPVGGIASIAAILHRKLADSDDVLVMEPVPKREGKGRTLRPVISLLRLVRGTLKVERSGRVLFFSSSGASFREKFLWAHLVLSLGRQVAIVMVDGRFPSVFLRDSSNFQKAARALFRRQGVFLVAQSPKWADTYRAIFAGATILTVSATVDPQFFVSRAHPGDDADTLTALYVGWITEEKGMIDLLDAIPLVLAGTNATVRFRLVGPAFGRESFWQQEIDRRGIREATNLCGPLSAGDDLLAEYRGADVFVFPSHVEGFPVALIEAVASALPCVATAVGGVADILDGGRVGKIVPPSRPRALAAALLEFLADPDLRRSVGAAASARARDAYNLEAFVNSYELALGIA
jgi:glycosyltransferase involved in cell wall biosynthesis